MKTYGMAKPYITNAEIAAVGQVLKSGVLSLGPVHLEFEKQFAKRVGTKYAVAVSSGTAGLHVAMLAAGVGPGDEVITSPFSFIASSNAVLYVGAKPVFVDIDPLTYNLDPRNVEHAITKKTKAILVVHIFGQATDMAPIMKIARKYKLKIIEDACESFGAINRGRQVGTFGIASVFAFYPNKQMTTGEGGMICTNSKKIYELCKSLSNQGRSPNMQWLDHVRLGYNYRLDEMSAAVGLEQLKKIDFLLREREKIASLYTKYLSQYPQLVQTPRTGPHNTHTWQVYVVKILKRSVNRDKLIAKLARRGISSKPYLPSIHMFSFYRKKFGFRPGDFPISEDLSKYSLALPFYLGLQEQDVAHIARQLINSITETL
ncbi:MAG: hypothetical protein A2846_03335 [Candidatus Doudnabacteria bacterium RIFCSPHIGHO2_01_FULL_49_9]|uniref:Polysaccharide biosynthesis protein n=1 Tax=Candidatus Doudnabacteria bacterium RIFCSPHIGHO2_01_FULL_49_9 TaxID=1817827 RepID=A0A1F5NYF6_9BACT|nr:MAG: hypothetical protein A2846_03335 [Candidatus Doudnabacteria bacterium RIFCSPHIGHO2_01_FULL_49_9]